MNNILRDEEIDLESNVRKTHFSNADRPTALYGLDMMILVVGYRLDKCGGNQAKALFYVQETIKNNWSRSICLNSLDAIWGFSFLWVTFGLQKLAFFLLHFLLHPIYRKNRI